jgi:hypothetical protein
LAARLPDTCRSVVQTLLFVLTDSAAAAEWQFGALEGLTMLRRASRLLPEDIEALRAIRLTPGRALFGEQFSAELLRAAQLRVYANELSDDDIGWLAVESRGGDPQARLVAITTLGETGRVGSPTVDWSLVGGLFDPADDVVIRAVVATERHGIAGDAQAVARRRLVNLYKGGSRRVRLQVVNTARSNPTLELSEILLAARSDRAWSIRREAAS